MANVSLAQYICLAAFPVGTIYMSRGTGCATTAAQVKTLRAGVGTWTQIQNQFLIGSGSVTDAESRSHTFSLGQTGGYDKIAANPPHTHSIAKGGAHGNHKINYTHATGGSGGYDCGVYNGTSGYSYSVGSAGSTHTHAVAAKGSASEAHDNLPYSYPVYIFYRSA